MVNYQGPELLRNWADRFDIPIFDRITAIHYFVRDPGTIKLEAEQVSALHQLRKVSVQQRQNSSTAVTSAMDRMRAAIPPCRLVSVETDTNQHVVVNVARQTPMLRCVSAP